MSQCNSRVQCSSKALLNENTSTYDYVIAPESRLHPNAVCVGSGSGAGVTCSNYGALRKTVGGPRGIGDPTLIQRSWRSSGCAPGALNDVVDTLSLPFEARSVNGVALNKGAEMTAYHTRNFQTSSASFQEKDISNYHLFPKNWSIGYSGMSAVGGWRPSRSNASCATTAKFNATANAPISATSYGSYGMF